MKVSFILLAHESSEKLKPLIETIVKAGSNIYIHYDASVDKDLKKECANWNIKQYPGQVFFADRVKVVWGEWSIVQATLNCIDKIIYNDDSSDYFMLLSGSCFPIKPIKLLEKKLALKNVDYIESVNAIANRWITSGIQDERWDKYHFFNWRYQQKLFDLSIKVQDKLKIKRKLPLDHVPHMGSQWWCLRKGTIKKIYNIWKNNKNIVSFYKRTWVPDELFFQTLVSNIVPKEEISPSLLTRYTFNAWGIPKVYYNDSYLDTLLDDKYFVRKISHSASFLKEKLSSIATMQVDEYNKFIEDECNDKRELISRKINNEKFCLDSKWHALCTSYENKFDYIKSIPNNITVVFPPRDRSMREVLNVLDKLPDTVVYGLLFDKREVNYGYDNKYFLGLSSDSTKLARSIWYQVLGEIAFKYPNKNVIFCLGEDDLDFLKILRWSTNVHVIFLDSNLDNVGITKEKEYLIRHDSYVKSKALSILEQKNCKVTRNNLGDLNTIVDHTILNSHSWRFLWENLSSLNKYFDYDNSHNDHYSVVKSIIQPTIVLVADTDLVLNKAISVLHNHHNLLFNSTIFNKLSNDEDKDWHYYLWDSSFLDYYILKRKIFSLVLPIAQLSRLDSLRWNKNLLVIHLKSKNFAQDILDQNFSPSEIKKSIDDIKIGAQEINNLMSSRNCDFLTFEENEFDCLIIDVWNWMSSRGVV